MYFPGLLHRLDRKIYAKDLVLIKNLYVLEGVITVI